MENKISKPIVGIVMGSKSDWETMKHAAETLKQFEIPYEVNVISAHRTPDRAFEYAQTAQQRGLEVIIAGAGGAAHLPATMASKTLLPVVGVPIPTQVMAGLDSLLSIVQMPAGVPVATMSIGKPGAINSALFAVSILACKYPEFRQKLESYRQLQAQNVLNNQITETL